MSTRTRLRLLLGVALALGLVFGSASMAGAHAVVLSLSPEPEAVLKTSPSEVALAFNEPVSATATAVRVFGPDGSQISGVRAVVEDTVLSAALPELDETGSYTVAWKVLSDDGHVISGAYLFHLREATLTAPVEVGDTGAAALPRVLKVIGAAATWSGLVFVLGMCAVGVRGKLRRSWILAGLAVIVAGTALSFGASVAAVGSGLADGVDVSLGTNSGKMALGALVVSLLALVGGAVVLRRGGDRSSRIAVQVGAALVLIVAALEGHAVALSPIAYSATLTVVHVSSTVVWLAGLVWIERRSYVATPEELAAEVRRRSPWAMGLVLVVVATGAGLLIKRVPAADLISSGYGLVGGLKLVLLGMALPLAWMNRGLFSPPTVEAATVARFRSTVRIEMLLLAAALVAGSVLAQISPPGGSGGFAGGYFSQKLAFGDGQVELTLDPGTRGMNEVHLTALGADGRLMAGIEDLELSMSLAAKDVGPLKPQLQVIVAGHSMAYVRFPFAGEWKVVATAKVEKFTELSATFDVSIGE